MFSDSLDFTNPSQSPPQEMLDWRRYNDQRVPFAGQAPLMSETEYLNRTTRCGIARSGIFDARDREYVQAGRTLEEILTKYKLGEYDIVGWNVYHNQVASNADCPPAIFIHVVWYEQFDVLSSKLLGFVETKLGGSTSGTNRSGASRPVEKESAGASSQTSNDDRRLGGGGGAIDGGAVQRQPVEQAASSQPTAKISIHGNWIVRRRRKKA